jgi:hypothetical protein
MFEDYAFIMSNWASFIEYDIMQDEEAASGAVGQVVCLPVSSIPKECAY